MPRLLPRMGPQLNLMSAFSGGCRASTVLWRRPVFGDGWNWAPIRLLCVAAFPSVKWGIWSPSCFEDHTRLCQKVLGLVTSMRCCPVGTVSTSRSDYLLWGLGSPLGIFVPGIITCAEFLDLKSHCF